MENAKECPIKSCLCKLLCLTLPVFIFLLAAGYVINHLWLMPVYEQTASVWRPADEMKDMMPWLFAFYAVLAVLISALFCKIKKAKMASCNAPADDAECNIGGKHCPIKFGICFGGIVGMMLGAMAAANYIWLPIPGTLAVDWFIGWVIQGIGAGVIMSLLCYCKQKKCMNK